jgi:hypothetical protein
MRTTRTIAAILSFSFAAAFAADQSAMEKCRATYDKELAAIQKNYAEQASLCKDTYVNGLARLQNALRKAGDLDGVQAVIREKERFLAEKGGMAEKDLSAIKDLRAAQDWYVTTMNKTSVDRAKKHVALADKYETALERLMQKLTIAGELDNAVDAKNELDRIRTDPEIVSSRAVMTQPLEKKEDTPTPKKTHEPGKRPEPQPEPEDIQMSIVVNSGFEDGKRKWRLSPDMKIVDDPEPAENETGKPGLNKVLRIPLSPKDTSTVGQGMNVKIKPARVRIAFMIRFGEDFDDDQLTCKEVFTRKRNTATITHTIRARPGWQQVELITTEWWDENTTSFEIVFPLGRGTIWIDDIAVIPVME